MTHLWWCEREITNMRWHASSPERVHHFCGSVSPDLRPRTSPGRRRMSHRKVQLSAATPAILLRRRSSGTRPEPNRLTVKPMRFQLTGQLIGNLAGKYRQRSHIQRRAGQPDSILLRHRQALLRRKHQLRSLCQRGCVECPGGSTIRCPPTSGAKHVSR